MLKTILITEPEEALPNILTFFLNFYFQDGNSQDPWGDVVATAGRLEVSGVEVFAVTVSHDHFFR